MIKNVTIIGSGVQGSMIAYRNLLYGKYVAIYDISETSLDNALCKIKDWLSAATCPGAGLP